VNPVQQATNALY